jgi:hypothetical protein
VYLVNIKQVYSDYFKYSIEENIMQLKYDGKWVNIRAIHRHLTKSPWKILHFNSKTKIVNHPLGCIFGGRNKLVAAKSYIKFNDLNKEHGIKIHMPKTYVGLSKKEVE